MAPFCFAVDRAERIALLLPDETAAILRFRVVAERSTMSQQNVNLVEGLLSGAAAMDKQALLDALPELIAQTCTPDIEWLEDPQRADGQVYRGHEGVRRSWERW